MVLTGIKASEKSERRWFEPKLLFDLLCVTFLHHFLASKVGLNITIKNENENIF